MSKGYKNQCLLSQTSRDINVGNLKDDINNSSLYMNELSSDVEFLSSQFNNVLSSLLSLNDQHPPQQTKCISLRPHAPWYTDTIRENVREGGAKDNFSKVDFRSTKKYTKTAVGSILSFWTPQRLTTTNQS